MGLIRSTFALLIFLGQASAAMAAENPIRDELGECVWPWIWKGEHKDAATVIHSSCATSAKRWMRACLDGNKGEPALADVQKKCEQELHLFTDELNDLAKNQRRLLGSKRDSALSPPVMGDLRVAQEDFRAGRPLPGLPNLRKPIYLNSGSFICSSTGALANPNKAVLLMMGSCIVAPHDVSVRVIIPRDAESYLHSHVFGHISIVVPTLEAARADYGYGWVLIATLRN